jgi:NDP-hexose-3-ketoreductase
MTRIGIICPSEIAFRRFLPALNNLSDFKYIGVAIANTSEWEGVNDYIINKEKEKAKKFIEKYNGKIFDSYTSLIESDEIDSIYLPLPPAMHYKWAKLALLSGKHILVEKPSTTSYNDTKELISIAEKTNLAIHENYMFTFHNQLKAINHIIYDGEIGDVRLYRISFGFPRRALNDFRYNKSLGGGALLDAGGYTLKYAGLLLGKTAQVVYAQSNYIPDFEVDISGSAALVNEQGITVQIAFGMDNSYKCDLEVWGSKGCLTTGRVLTAPAGFIPEVTLKTGNDTETRQFPTDDAFKKSIQYFQKCIEDEKIRKYNYQQITRQAHLINSFFEKANKK